MQRIDEFLMDGNRYDFDFGECHVSLGYAQVDTSQDAPYFGIWTNPTTLNTVSYMEGDVIRETAESVEEYVAYIRKMVADYEEMGRPVKGIDPMLNSEIENRFKEIGLGDLLH